jgi:hypothetical protein
VQDVPEDEWLTWLAGFGAGDYTDAVLRWEEGFPAGQLHIAWFDELTAEPATYLGRILEHIGSRSDAAALAERHAGVVNAAARGGAAPPPQVHRAIADRVLPDLDRLRSVIDDPGWVEQWQARARALPL